MIFTYSLADFLFDAVETETIKFVVIRTFSHNIRVGEHLCLVREPSPPEEFLDVRVTYVLPHDELPDHIGEGCTILGVELMKEGKE